jgi:excisionase family DNA binding protein
MKRPILAEKETLTVEEAISLFGLSRRKFRRLIESTELCFMALYGSRRLVIRTELERWLKHHPTEKEELKNGTYRKTANTQG